MQIQINISDTDLRDRNILKEMKSTIETYISDLSPVFRQKSQHDLNRILSSVTWAETEWRSIQSHSLMEKIDEDLI